jgi:hypothetical protein
MEDPANSRSWLTDVIDTLYPVASLTERKWYWLRTDHLTDTQKTFYHRTTHTVSLPVVKRVGFFRRRVESRVITQVSWIRLKIGDPMTRNALPPFKVIDALPTPGLQTIYYVKWSVHWNED